MITHLGIHVICGVRAGLKRLSSTRRYIEQYTPMLAKLDELGRINMDEYKILGDNTFEDNTFEDVIGAYKHNAGNGRGSGKVVRMIVDLRRKAYQRSMTYSDSTEAVLSSF